MRYFIKIANINNKYCFQLWYIAKQEMGSSKEYDSYELCKKGLDEFKDFIIKNDIHDECQFLELTKNDKYFIYRFKDKNGNTLYTSRNIESKKSCKDSMINTCKNIKDAKIKEEN